MEACRYTFIIILSPLRISCIHRCMWTWWIVAVPIGCGTGLCPGLEYGSGIRVGVAAGVCWDVGLSVGFKFSDILTSLVSVLFGRDQGLVKGAEL